MQVPVTRASLTCLHSSELARLPFCDGLDERLRIVRLYRWYYCFYTPGPAVQTLTPLLRSSVGTVRFEWVRLPAQNSCRTFKYLLALRATELHHFVCSIRTGSLHKSETCESMNERVSLIRWTLVRSYSRAAKLTLSWILPQTRLRARAASATTNWVMD